MEKFMSGDQLYRYLHISKRKMKYLLENGYLPAIDTGMKTHRYKIRIQDAKVFKQRMINEPEFLSELAGNFSTRPQKKHVLIEPTKENCKAFNNYLIKCFAGEPDALAMSHAAGLIGYAPQRISNLCTSGAIWSAVIKGRRYCSKENLISYISSAKIIANPNKTEKYKELMQNFINSGKDTQIR